MIDERFANFQDLERQCDEHYNLMFPFKKAFFQALVENAQLETDSSNFVAKFKGFVGLE